MHPVGFGSTNEPVFCGSHEQQLAQQQAWEQTISRCDTCRTVIFGLGHVDRITCARCWHDEHLSPRAARYPQHHPRGYAPQH